MVQLLLWRQLLSKYISLTTCSFEHSFKYSLIHRLTPHIFASGIRHVSGNDKTHQQSTSSTTKQAKREHPPDPPTCCCMSGCPSCVWIEYAERLANYYADGGEKARREIEKIPDPILKAFLQMELKSRL